LRDRIVGMYENNERTLVICDINNQVFIDGMYLQHPGPGGTAPRGTL
jgi:hypothetical protein